MQEYKSLCESASHIAAGLVSGLSRAGLDIQEDTAKHIANKAFAYCEAYSY